MLLAVEPGRTLTVNDSLSKQVLIALYGLSTLVGLTENGEKLVFWISAASRLSNSQQARLANLMW